MSVKDIIELLVVPLLGVLTTFLVSFLRVKSDELKAKINNNMIAKYITLGEQIIESAVVAVNQTFVEELKKNEKFTKEKQKEAFEKCKSIVLSLLTDNVRTMLEYIYGDLDSWIETKIELYVNNQKNDRLSAVGITLVE